MTVMRVRPEGPADVLAIRTVLAEAFASAGEGEPPEVALVEQLRDSPAWLPELSVVVEADGVVVGYALLSRVTAGESAAPALALGPVAVRPAEQRRGYGTAVVRAALDGAAELGERLVLVLGEPAFYGRFGFALAAERGLSSPWSGPHFQALVLPAAVSGDPVPRGEVRYPAIWSAF